jgi:hypothetical protein
MALGKLSTFDCKMNTIPLCILTLDELVSTWACVSVLLGTIEFAKSRV